jgi:hypothetical protein
MTKRTGAEITRAAASRSARLAAAVRADVVQKAVDRVGVRRAEPADVGADLDPARDLEQRRRAEEHERKLGRDLGSNLTGFGSMPVMKGSSARGALAGGSGRRSAA